jgi:cytochrome c-type biogenesis protein CcmF
MGFQLLKMQYTGEHLLPGQLGHFFIVLSLVASLAASFAYFKAANESDDIQQHLWKKLARLFFIAETVSIISIFAILFYIIHNHLFEYHYAWKHSNRALEFKYLLACFWEGQEGSFLLWSFWHCVLGLIIMRWGKVWEAPVMSVISFAQFCLATMVTGIYFLGWRMGTNPFILLRESGVLDNAPALHIDFDINQPLKADYLSSVKDGNGLNKLLQNYWMVIHPPVLFLGFASTVVPFAFAVAGLWKNKLAEWAKPALPWTLFSAAALGIGIMMGAAWAYESLSFGGYWAWDPVENASLVPWLILVSGIHTLLIYKSTGRSLRASFLFSLLSFFFILYSTFLTRTGILGDTSVHAFTGEGDSFYIHILLFLAILTIPAFVLFAIRYRNIPSIKKEEELSSREFWMFIGSLVFFLSGLVIIGITSLPVFNKVFGTKIAPPEKIEFLYNSIHVYVAIIVAVLSGFSQYLKYKHTATSFFWKKIGLPTLIAAIAAALILYFGKINYTKETAGFMASIWIALACSIYAIITNASYIFSGLKGKLKFAGGSVAHVGFGLVLLGILISSGKKEVISTNTSGIFVPLGEGENPGENLTLVQGMKMDMGKYHITYEKDSLHPQSERTFFNIRFQEKETGKQFLLQPNSFINANGQEGLMSNPDAMHYLQHDVFVYITSISDPDKLKDTAQFKTTQLKIGDTLFYSAGFMVLQAINKKDSLPEDLFGNNGTLHEAPLKIFAKTGSTYSVTPRLAVAKGEAVTVADTIRAENLIVQLQKVNTDQSINLGVIESNAIMKYVTIKAYKFPFILLLWGGVLITAIGICISMVQRIRQKG